jgi:Bacterial capsule synthesis protein PGA_cap
MLREDIAFVRTTADLIIVSLHKGIVHTPATLAPYERPLGHAAIDAGADIVIGHHAHILKGIETYLGKPIFHGLGNGCVVTEALNPDQDHPGRRAWAEERKTRFGFEPDPDYSLAPFHPEAVNAMIGRLVWHEDGRIEAGIVPVHIEAPGRPVLVNGAKGREIADYVEKITVDAGMPPISLIARDDMMVLA